MSETLIGGILLLILGVAMELIAQTLRRSALMDPELRARQAVITEAKAKAAEINGNIAKMQAELNQTMEEMERARLQIRANESRQARVTRNFRIVVEHGMPSGKMKRFDGSVYNKNSNSLYSSIGGTTVPTFFAHEVQVIIWAENLVEARNIFEKAYLVKDGYQSVFHGDIFGGRT
jgi:hypothetical protein